MQVTIVRSQDQKLTYVQIALGLMLVHIIGRILFVLVWIAHFISVIAAMALVALSGSLTFK